MKDRVLVVVCPAHGAHAVIAMLAVFCLALWVVLGRKVKNSLRARTGHQRGMVLQWPVPVERIIQENSLSQQLVSPPKSASLRRGGRAAHVWACSTQETRGESVSSSDCEQRAGRTRARRGMFGAVSCRVDLRARSASLDAAQEAVTAGAAHRHRSVLKRRSCRHRGGGRARCAHDKTCVRDGGELGRRWWAENASRYGRAGPRRALRRNRTLRTRVPK